MQGLYWPTQLFSRSVAQRQVVEIFTLKRTFPIWRGIYWERDTCTTCRTERAGRGPGVKENHNDKENFKKIKKKCDTKLYREMGGRRSGRKRIKWVKRNGIRISNTEQFRKMVKMVKKGTIMINATQSNLERRLSETSSERQLKYPTQRALMEHFWGF